MEDRSPEEKKEWSYESKSDEEIKNLVKAYFSDRAFFSFMLNVEDVEELARLMKLVFMPLSFLDQDQLDEMEKQEIAILYEYFSEAGPRSMNGFPMFHSFKMLNKKDFERFIDETERYKKLMEEFDNQ